MRTGAWHSDGRGRTVTAAVAPHGRPLPPPPSSVGDVDVRAATPVTATARPVITATDSFKIIKNVRFFFFSIGSR